MTTLPNFFVLGAGRCGTTSLTEHLRRHPDVFIPAIKEPSFFAESWQWVRNPVDYADLYRAAGAPLRGDASHLYLEDPSSPRTIRAFFPDARFVLMFRNPAERAVALYATMVEHGYEHHRTFERALAAEDRRFSSKRFRRSCPHSFWNFMYFRSGLFGEQIGRYLDIWPRHRFYATTLYEYLASPDRVIREVLEFLEAAPADLGPVPHAASSKGTRSPGVQVLERRVLRGLERRRIPLAGAARSRLVCWNRTEAKPTARPETLAKLTTWYRADLAILNERLGVDIGGSEAEFG